MMPQSPDAAASYRGALVQSPHNAEAWCRLGNVLKLMGFLKEAIAAYGVATRISPQYPEALFNRSVALYELGGSAAALAGYRTVLVIEPDSAVAHSNCGTALKELGRALEALAAYQTAVHIAPDSAELLVNLASVVSDFGRTDEALAIYRAAIRIRPDFAEGYSSLAAGSNDLGRFGDAATACKIALCLKPDYVEAYSNRGVALKGFGRHEEALKTYDTALRLRPDHVKSLSNRGLVLLDLDRQRESLASLDAAILLKPDVAELHSNRGLTLNKLGRLDESLVAYKTALSLKPDSAGSFANLGSLWNDLGRPGIALACFDTALHLVPDHAEAHSNRGLALKLLNKPDEALTVLRTALCLQPDSAVNLLNLGSVLGDLGYVREALSAYDAALSIASDFVDANSNMLFALSASPDISADELFARHCAFGQRFETFPDVAFDHDRDPDRPVRLGFVSGDLNNHPVGQFLEPVLVQLRRDSSLSLHAYANDHREDALSQRLRGAFDSWTCCVGINDEELAARIRSDRIDILIDLAGHTGKNRLLAFARHAAPVQASWFGYIGTTGLRSMHYYFADRYLVPDESVAAQFTEKIVTLSSYSAFSPPFESPEINALPASRQKVLTFGSFNNLRKVSRDCVALWSELLRALPASRLLIAGLPASGGAPLIEWFAEEGIAAERLTLRRKCSWQDYMALHHEVDIALDAYPCGGGMTTKLALWMGVPTLTFRGNTPAGGICATYLHHVGLADYVARDKQDFIRRGQRLAEDLEGLGRLRAGLRQIFLQSDIGNPQRLTESLSQALRAMWTRWCDGLPPAPIHAGKR